MIFLFSIVSLLNFSCIFLFSSLLSATGTNDQALPAKHLNHVNINNFLGLNYYSFAMDVDALSRACSTKLLTNASMLVAVQQNVHSILRLLFGDYHVDKNSLKSIEIHRTKRLKAQGRFDIDVAEIFNEKFIGYTEALGCLVVARIIKNGQQNVQSSEYYPVKVQLPPAGILYRKLIAKGVDLNFMLRCLPRIISLYEADFKSQVPGSLILTKKMNAFVKEFVWERCQIDGENIEHPSLSTLEHLYQKFFEERLNAKICTISQGYNGYLHAHLTSKPCTVYENKVFFSMGYLKDRIQFIEQYKPSICPLIIDDNLQNNLFYCIYTYNPNEGKEIYVKNFKEYEQETITSPIKAALPLMKVPEGTVLITYFIIPTERLLKLIILEEKNQRCGFNEIGDIDMGKHQDIKGIPSHSSIISDEKLCILMKHFASYLSSKISKDLIKKESFLETMKMLNLKIKELAKVRNPEHGS